MLLDPPTTTSLPRAQRERRLGEREERPVFLDPGGRRARRVRRASIAVATVTALWLASLVIAPLGFFSLPHMPRSDLRLASSGNAVTPSHRWSLDLAAVPALERVPPAGMNADAIDAAGRGHAAIDVAGGDLPVSFVGGTRPGVVHARLARARRAGHAGRHSQAA